MPKTIRQSMMEKGWKEKDIAEAEEILYSEDKQEKHSSYIAKVNPMIYWMGLLVAIVGNLIIAVFLIPFFMVMTSIQLYVIIGTMGLIFGAMFNFLLRDIEQVDYKHHVIAGIFIPALAVITIFVIVQISNAFATIINSPIHQNAGIIVTIYTITFTTPYLIYKWSDVSEEKKQKVRMAARKSALPSEDGGEGQQPAQPKDDYSSPEEAWKVYQQRKEIADNRVEQDMLDKYRKYL